MKLSNKFTTMRLCFAPFFFILYNLPIWINSPLLSKITAFSMIPLLAFFEFTDYLDGFFARKYNEVSDFGKIYDPFADVLLNLSVFAGAINSVGEKGFAPIVLFVLLFYREFTMTFLRMVALSKGVAIAARKGGKFKTVFYIFTGFFMLAQESALRLGFDVPHSETLRTASIILMVVCVVLSYISFIDYIRVFVPALRKTDGK